jgi:hypothetical protein
MTAESSKRFDLVVINCAPESNPEETLKIIKKIRAGEYVREAADSTRHTDTTRVYAAEFGRLRNN